MSYISPQQNLLKFSWSCLIGLMNFTNTGYIKFFAYILYQQYYYNHINCGFLTSNLVWLSSPRYLSYTNVV